MKTDQRAVTSQMKSSKHKKLTKAILAAIAASMLAGLFSFVIDRNTLSILEDALKAKQSATQEVVISRDELITKGLSAESNQWEITDNVPEITVDNVNRKVDYVCLDYSYGDDWKSGYNLFWTNNEATDFEENFTGAYSDIGKPYVLMSCGEKVKSIKIRLGKQEGKSLQVDDIVINPDLKSRLKDNLYKAIAYKFQHPKRYIEKYKILLVLFLVCLLPYVVGWDYCFKKRWVIGLAVLVFIVANQYNGDSLSVYDSYIQPGEGSEYVAPLMGEERVVRSDEWAYSNPVYLSTNYLESVFDKTNPIVRGTDTINEYAITWYSFYNTFNIISSILRKTIGMGYAYSFKWFGLIIFTALINIEFFLILTKGKKLLSVACASMIVLSSHFLWWGFPSFVTAIPSAFVCLNGILKANNVFKRFIWAIGAAMSMAYYVLFFYPAWQVPSGYLMIPIFVWMITENFEQIKRLCVKDWLVIGAAVALLFAMIGGYLIDNSGYIHAMMNTSYPGKRFSTGGLSLQRIFNYIAAGLFPYKDIANPSAESTYISLFPLPILAALFYQHKNKWKNKLVSGLLIYTLIMLVYCAFGFPSWLSKYTLMSYSPGHRTAEVLSYSEVILFSAVFANWSERHRIGKTAAAAVAITFASAGLFFARLRLPDYMPSWYMLFAFVLFTVISFLLVYRCGASKERTFEKIVCTLLIAFSMITGIYIRPIAKGLDAIYSKPVYPAIREIMEKEPDAKWFTHGLCLSGYLLASGAPCIDSNNYYPNAELWSKLDEKNIYYEKYNRYANINIVLTDDETTMDNPQPDVLSICLSYKDLKKTDTDYILSNEPMAVDNEYVTFDCIYSKSGIYIYRIAYKQ